MYVEGLVAVPVTGPDQLTLGAADSFLLERIVVEQRHRRRRKHGERERRAEAGDEMSVVGLHEGMSCGSHRLVAEMGNRAGKRRMIVDLEGQI